MLLMVLHKNNFKGKEIFSALSKYEVKRRGDMEDDPSFKQLISYCLLEMRRANPYLRTSFWWWRRTVTWSVINRCWWSYERCC